MSGFWGWYIIVIVVINIVGTTWLLLAMRKPPRDFAGADQPLVHNFDGIEELNNPLPNWWLWAFVLAIVWAVVYLALYPGLGRFAGALFPSPFTAQQRRPFVSIPNQTDLVTLKELAESGSITPVIDRVFPLSETAAAFDHVGAGHSQGKSVVAVVPEGE